MEPELEPGGIDVNHLTCTDIAYIVHSLIQFSLGITST